MSVKTCTVVSLIFLIQALLFSLATSYPLTLKDYLDLQEKIPQKDNQDSNWSNLPANVRPVKRVGCAGFPCMYTHMAAKAGRASLYRTLARIIDDCAMDPSCSPGRRKRAAAILKKWS